MNKRITCLILSGLLLSTVVIMSGCVEEEAEIRAQSGDTVKVHYTGTLDDGTVFDSSIGRDPLQFTVDSGQMIVGFNRAVNGMKLGEKKTVKIPADQAYGQYREDLVQVVNRSELPEEMEPEVGQQLMSQQADGRIIVFTVISISELNVTLDANHRLAGEDLTFEIELVEIV